MKPEFIIQFWPQYKGIYIKRRNIVKTESIPLTSSAFHCILMQIRKSLAENRIVMPFGTCACMKNVAPNVLTLMICLALQLTSD